MSKLLTQMIKFDEGCMVKPYVCSAGKLTIGYGRNLQEVGITEKEAEHLLQNDLERVELEFMSMFGQERITKMGEVRAAALQNMLFQLGFRKFRGFVKMLDAIDQGNYALAADEALDSRWAKQTPERAKRITHMLHYGEIPSAYNITC